MAEHYEAETLRSEDMVAVRSRVSWGAIIAGVVVALAAFMLLSTFGVAVGLSVNEGADAGAVGIGAGIWAIVVTLVSLFLGGWITSQCTAGENKQEAAFYGIVVWGVLFSVLLFLAAGGVNLGMSAMMGTATVSNPQAQAGQLTEGLNLSEEQMTQFQENFEGALQTGSAAGAAWWTFAGMLLSMIAAVGGAIVGAGPHLALRGMRIHVGGRTHAAG